MGNSDDDESEAEDREEDKHKGNKRLGEEMYALFDPGMPLLQVENSNDDDEGDESCPEAKRQKWSVPKRRNTGARSRIRRTTQEEEPSEEEEGRYTHVTFSTKANSKPQQEEEVVKKENVRDNGMIFVDKVFNGSRLPVSSF